ncbi:Pept-C1 domain-containing protein [Aphelenchoides besseyi]|nr:Pept-C1 domain-containing protein [Aphelenchoides besseyi]
MQLASLFLFVIGVQLSLAVPAPNSSDEVKGQELVDRINKQDQWKAALPPRFAGKTIEQIRGHLGAIKKPRSGNLPELFKNSTFNDVPSFNSRKNWPKCTDIIGHIYDQSACASWAVSTAASVSDQIYIKTDGKNKTTVSAIDLTSCCSSCGNGCQGGAISEAFNYLYKMGVVTGSDYSDDSYCKPYPYAPCEHHNNKTTYQKCGDVVDTPKCTKLAKKVIKIVLTIKTEFIPRAFLAPKLKYQHFNTLSRNMRTSYTINRVSINTVMIDHRCLQIGGHAFELSVGERKTELTTGSLSTNGTLIKETKV